MLSRLGPRAFSKAVIPPCLIMIMAPLILRWCKMSNNGCDKLGGFVHYFKHGWMLCTKECALICPPCKVYSPVNDASKGLNIEAQQWSFNQKRLILSYVSFHDIIFFFQNLKPTSWRNMTKSNLKASLRLEQEAYLRDNALLALSVCSSPTTSWFSACEHKHTSQSSKIYITWNQKEQKTPRKQMACEIFWSPSSRCSAQPFQRLFSLLQELPHRDIPQPTMTAGRCHQTTHGSKGLDGKVCGRPNTIQRLRSLFCLRFIFFKLWRL